MQKHDQQTVGQTPSMWYSCPKCAIQITTVMVVGIYRCHICSYSSCMACQQPAHPGFLCHEAIPQAGQEFFDRDGNQRGFRRQKAQSIVQMQELQRRYRADQLKDVPLLQPQEDNEARQPTQRAAKPRAAKRAKTSSHPESKEDLFDCLICEASLEIDQLYSCDTKGPLYSGDSVPGHLFCGDCMHKTLVEYPSTRRLRHNPYQCIEPTCTAVFCLRTLNCCLNEAQVAVFYALQLQQIA